MVYLTTVEIPNDLSIASLKTGSSINKTGNRREYRLDSNNAFVRRIVDNLHIQKPLRFASLMEALPGKSTSQSFHMDSTNNSRTNAIVYLTDVPEESYGPIEFQGIGPVLGTRGTTAVYSANEMHRGVANQQDETRYAITMAFAESDEQINTIGGPAPITAPSNNQDILFAIVLIVSLVYLYMNNTGSSTNLLALLAIAVALSLVYANKKTEPEVITIDANGANMNSYTYTFTNGTRGFNTLRFKIVGGTNYSGVNDVNIEDITPTVDLASSNFTILANGATAYDYQVSGSRMYLDAFTGNVTQDTIYEVFFNVPVTSFRFYTND